MTSGDGKRSAYDTDTIVALRFQDAAGSYAEYALTSPYSGRTLLSIVQGCMGSLRSNTGGTAWANGQCTNVGTLVSSSGVTGAAALRIGVGDGGADTADWALFMPVSGNGNGDFNGAKIWCFGCAGKANNGFTGSVYIYAIGPVSAGASLSVKHALVLERLYKG